MDDCVRDLDRKLRLTDRESLGIKVRSTSTKKVIGEGFRCLVGKILSSRLYGGDVVYETMKLAWNLPGDFDCKSIGSNTFFFKFANRVDLLRVRNGGPWNFDSNLMVLEQFNGDFSPLDYKFNKVRFWVHVTDPPLKCMSLECARKIGDLLGTFLEWDKGVGNIVWSRRMRIKVELDLEFPLMRGTNLNLEDGGSKWVDFLYERLPNYCFWCGRIGHRMGDCEIMLAVEEDGILSDPPLRLLKYSCSK